MMSDITEHFKERYGEKQFSPQFEPYTATAECIQLKLLTENDFEKPIFCHKLFQSSNCKHSHVRC